DPQEIQEQQILLPGWIRVPRPTIWAKYVMTDRDNDLFGYVERANDLARFGLAEARRSVLSLQSMIIKDSGLIESLQMLAERSNIAGRLRCTFRSNLKDDQSLPAFTANRSRGDQQCASARQINGYQHRFTIGSTEPGSQS